MRAAATAGWDQTEKNPGRHREAINRGPSNEEYRMNTISTDVLRLTDRLRLAADEIESAARFGVPVPHLVSVSGHEYGGLSFAATEAEFEAWAEYTEAIVDQHEHDGAMWSSVDRVDVNGLPVRFSVRHDAEATR